ncbi:MAG: hypothetical protein OHK0039_16710 [Bacteroidia bacterium]
MSPRTSQQLDDIREQSKTKIIEAATSLFALQGYHSTSIQQIAKEAGVAKGLIYNYFESKEDLMNAIFMVNMAEGEAIIARLEACTTAADKLRFLIDISFEYVLNRPLHTKLMIGLALQMDHFPKLKALVIGKYTGLMPMMAHLLGEMGVAHPLEEARLLATAMDGFSLQYIVLGDTARIHEMQQYLYLKYGLNNGSAQT